MTTTPPAEPTVSQQVEWCNQARLLLKKTKLQALTKSGTRHELKKEIQQIEKLLVELQALVTPARFLELKQPFDALAAEMHAAESERGYVKQRAKVKAAAEKFPGVIAGLRTARDAALGSKGAREAYLAAKTKAERDAAPFKIHNELFMSLKVLIDATDREVQVGTQQAYQAATTKLTTAFAMRLAEMETAREALLGRNDQQIQRRAEAEQLLAATRAVLAEVATWPGIDVEIAKYETVIASAQSSLAEQLNIEAIEAIQAAGLKSKAELQALSGGAIDGVSVDAEAFKQALAAAEASLAKLEPLVPAEVTAQYRTELADLSRQVVAGTDADTALASLQELAATIQRRYDELANLGAELEPLLVEIERRQTWLQENVDSPRVAAFALRLAEIRTLRASQRTADARERATALRTEVNAEHDAVNAAVEALRSKDVPALRAKIETLRAAWPGGDVLGPLLLGLIKVEQLRSVDPVGALEEFVRVEARLAEVQAGEFEQYRALDGDRARIDGEMETAFNDADAALERYAGEVKGARAVPDAEGESPSLEARRSLAALRQQWSVARGKHTEKPALEGEAEQIKTALRELVGSLPSATGAAAEQDRAVQRARFERAVTPLQAAIDRIETLRRGEASAIESGLAQAISAFDDGNGDVAGAIQHVEALMKTAQVVIQNFTGEGGVLAQLRKAAELNRKLAEDGVKALNKKLGGGFLRAGEYKPFIEKLEEELADCAPLLGSTSESGIREADRLYVELKAKIDALATDMDSTDPSAVSFSAVNTELEWMKEFVEKNAELKALAPNQRVLFTKQYEGLKEKAHESSPQESLADIRAAKADMQKFEQELRTRKAAREFVATMVKGGETMLGELDKNLEYVKQLKQRLADVKTTSTTEGKEGLAKTQLDTLLRDIAQANSSPDVLQANEVRLRGEQQGEVERARALEERYTVAKGQVEQARGVVKTAKGDEKQVEELVRLLGMAKDKLKKKDLGGAERDIDLIQIRSKVVMKNPHGAALGARKELKKQYKLLKDSVTEYGATLKKLPAAIRELDDTGLVDDQQLGGLRRSVEKLAVQFRTEDVEPLINMLVDGRFDVEGQRRLREEILGVLRRELGKIAKSPAVKAFRVNPIDRVDLPQAIKKVENSIQRLVGNVQRSVQ